MIAPSCVMGDNHSLCRHAFPVQLGMRAWQRAMSSGQVAASVSVLISSVSRGQRDTLCWLTPACASFYRKRSLSGRGRLRRMSWRSRLGTKVRCPFFLWGRQFPFTCIRLERCREGGRVMKLHSLDYYTDAT